MASLRAARLRPGTTPLLTAVVDGEAIQDATVYVTIDMNGRQFTKSNYYDDGNVTLTAMYDDDSNQTGTQVDVQYSQEETLCLRPGYAKIEIGWVFSDGSADKTDIGRITIPDSLYKGVMIYGRG